MNRQALGVKLATVIHSQTISSSWLFNKRMLAHIIFSVGSLYIALRKTYQNLKSELGGNVPVKYLLHTGRKKICQTNAKFN